MTELRITRPKPSAEWTFEWVQTRDLNGTRHNTAVEASYNRNFAPRKRTSAKGAAGPPYEYDESEPTLIRITDKWRHIGGVGTDRSAEINLDRKAAEDLIDALNAALAWDGT